MATRITWRGKEVAALADRAAKLAIDATMAAAILHAKANHSAGAHSQQRFVTHHGGAGLEGGIRITSPAARDSRGVVGRWGAIGIVYARRIELGFQGQDSRGRSVDAPAYPFLRPAAEAEYPKLRDRVRRAFRMVAA